MNRVSTDFFRTVREQGGRHYLSRADFISGAETHNVLSPRLCNVLAAFNETRIDPVRQDERNSDGATEPERPPLTRSGGSPKAAAGRELPLGLPWVTPVLGSGCLPAAGASPEVDLGRRCQKILDLLDESSLSEAGEVKANAGDLVEFFLRSLVHNRLGGASVEFFLRSLVHNRLGGASAEVSDDAAEPSGAVGDAPGPDPDELVDESFADLVLVATLLTRMYHLAKAMAPDAVGRWGEDDASVPPGKELPWVDVPRFEDAINAALNRLLTNERWESHHDLLKKVQNDLAAIGPEGSVIRLSRLRFLTEYVWNQLSSIRPPYPGWTDLLFELSLKEHGDDDYDGPGLPRPSFPDLRAPGAHVGGAYEMVTRRAWGHIRENPDSVEGTVHDAVAELLIAQAAVLQREDLSGDRPLACAFVSTFDLEVEMALLARNAPFVIVFPVQVQRHGQVGASLHWLASVVDPTAEDLTTHGLSLLRDPRRIALLRQHDTQPYTPEDEDLAKLPAVVRLTGCPLINLPVLDEPDDGSSAHPIMSALRRTRGSSDARLSDVSHAVLLDEYVAMQQSTAGEKGGSARLPDAFGRVGSATWARYWMVLGVQLHDSAVRHRLTGHLGGLASRSAGGNVALPSRNGVFVNRNLDSVHRDLLYWYGFDVVSSERSHCEDFSEDLYHLAAHLREPFRSWKTLIANTCHLDSEKDR